ncbi:hypothetical protein DICVIV_10247 [Dictyocaulus viviparus]|uniref:Replication factor C small subunit n=1 Tax=Dictyocaulus viviparus TaxID=29172 RepID=A0A0D8XGE9_DICVI|nr:hypothetical protein DICVIV_10247 [Dictyocaulus viviparus]
MSLWVDKYRPKRLSELTYHLEQANDFAELVKTNDFPHLLLYGPSGAGKRTRIHCILRELYGSGAQRLRLDRKSLTTPSNRKIEIDTVSSNYHIEMNPGEVGIYDRVVVQEIIKQIAQTSQIASSTQKSFKVVVLMEADQLTLDAQHALRRTMEKYSMSCRLIICCESLSRIIDPLKSRCMTIRIAAPTDDEIVTKARGNVRRALLSMEAVKRKGLPIKDNEQVPEPEWEIYIRETAELIMKKQSNENVIAVRERLYELISRCIQPSTIFCVGVKYLLRELLKRSPQSIRLEIIEVAALYEHRLRKGQKAIIHLEAFVVAFMDIYLNSIS